VRRSVLLQVSSVLAAIITVFGVIRAFVLISESIDGALRVSSFLATIGVAIAAPPSPTTRPRNRSSSSRVGSDRRR